MSCRRPSLWICSSRNARWPRGVGALLLLPLLALVGCGGDDAPTASSETGADVAGTPDAGPGGTPDATGSADASGSDASNDGGAGEMDAGATDAGATDAAVAPCQRPQIGCVGPCRVDFFSASAGRDNVIAIAFENVLGAPMQATDVRIAAGGSPYVRLSESWFDYMDRAGGGTWVASEDGLGFATVGTPIPIGVGESFTVDVFFAEHEATGPQCPGGDTRACAELIVSFDDCAGGAVEQRIPVQI